MTFTPVRTIVSNITNANPAVVTTSSNHELTRGMVVRLNIPRAYGMTELNRKLFVVTVLSATTFSLQTTEYPSAQNVNSVSFVPFVTPSSVGVQPECVPVGSAPVPNSTNKYFETQLYDQVANT